MARSKIVRSAAVGGVLGLALLASSGVAGAAPAQYGGTATGGITVVGSGTAVFEGSGFAPNEPVTVTVSYCGETHTYTTTAAADGTISVRAAGAGPTSYVATGTTGGVTRTVSASAVMAATCSARGVVDPSGAVGGTGSGGSGGSLPFTGFEAGVAGAIGLGAIGAGSVIIIGSRRRRNPSAS